MIKIEKEEQLRKNIDALKDILNEVFGADQIVIRATKLETLDYLASDDLEEQLTALERIVFYDPLYDNSGESFPSFE